MDTCEECGADFDPEANLAAGEPFEDWCSHACERAWRLRQVDDPRQVAVAGMAERVAERLPFAVAFGRWQLGLQSET